MPPGHSTRKQRATGVPTAATVDLKLEVVVIPVSDVDSAKRFYEGRGGGSMPTLPPARTGGWSSSRLRDRRARSTSARESPRPRRGSFKNLYLVVSDMEAARRELNARGADVSPAFHFTAFGAPPFSGPDPNGGSYKTVAKNGA
jgi:predicted enzyme related to lactoylglutathione lyase